MRPLGPVQLVVIERSRGSAGRFVMPANFLERRALRRLTARGMACKTGPDLWRVGAWT